MDLVSVGGAATRAAGTAAPGPHVGHSYVSADRQRASCIYDAPDPESISTVAGVNNLPVDQIKEVRVLDPYFYVESLA
jgi:hypothetical protein